jgi:hypothetical protein
VRSLPYTHPKNSCANLRTKAETQTMKAISTRYNTAQPVQGDNLGPFLLRSWNIPSFALTLWFFVLIIHCATWLHGYVMRLLLTVCDVTPQLGKGESNERNAYTFIKQHSKMWTNIHVTLRDGIQKSYTFSLILGATSKFWVTRKRFHTEAPQLVAIIQLLVVPWCVRTCIERMRVPTPCDAPALLPFPWFI